VYLTQSLHRAAQQTPDLPASIFGERVRTYAEQLDRVSRLAGALRSHGVANGAPVAILSLNSDRYLELLQAVPWADGVLVPVNTRWSPAARMSTPPRSRTRCASTPPSPRAR
jgi:acyl-CoA synthetase (AMP-forming)/AMP-acid ligase II